MNFITPTLSIIDPILKFFGKILYFFDSITGNYLFAIFLFALFAKLILFPFAIKQQKNQQKQASLRPKEMAIRKKYKGRDDKASQLKMQQEINDMYQQEKYNVFGGCLPMLIQLPFILLLYGIITKPLTYISGLSSENLTVIKDFIKTALPDISTSSELQLVSAIQANFEQIAEGVKETLTLSSYKIPNFTLFGSFDIGGTPSLSSFNLLLLIPVLTFVFQFLSMRLTRKLSYQPAATGEQNCSIKIMDYMFPLVTVYMTFQFPAILGIYWMFQNIIGVLQQLLLKKMFPFPVFTEEDYKKAELALRGKSVKEDDSVSRIDPNKKYRSLHRIDEEEDENVSEFDYSSRYDEEEANEELKNSQKSSNKTNEQISSDIPKLKEENPKRKNKK